MGFERLLEARFAKHGLGKPDGRQPFLSKSHRIVTGELPEWWHANRNVLIAPPAASVPAITFQNSMEPPRGAVVILGSGSVLTHIELWGEHPFVIAGANVKLIGSYLVCGTQSTIVIGDDTYCQNSPVLNARNGGIIYVAGEGMWSESVRIYTDDMHAIRDATTGRRLNAFGGAVLVERHVWLCYDVLLLPGSRIGHDCVIGARSVVTGTLPPHSVCVGSPARVVRSGITWSSQDLP